MEGKVTLLVVMEVLAAGVGLARLLAVAALEIRLPYPRLKVVMEALVVI